MTIIVIAVANPVPYQTGVSVGEVPMHMALSEIALPPVPQEQPQSDEGILGTVGISIVITTGLAANEGFPALAKALRVGDSSS